MVAICNRGLNKKHPVMGCFLFGYLVISNNRSLAIAVKYVTTHSVKMGSAKTSPIVCHVAILRKSSTVMVIVLEPVLGMINGLVTVNSSRRLEISVLSVAGVII